MSSADAPSAAVRTMIPPSFGSSSLMISFRRARSASSSRRETPEALALRDEDEEAAGKRDLGREPRALRLHRILDGLHEQLLPARDQVGDLLAVPLALELGHDDLVDVEEAVLLEADLDERGLHSRQDVVDGAEVDVPGDRALLGPLEVDLGDAVVLEDGDALLADVDRDQELALGLRQRGAALRRAAARLAGAAFLALAPLGGRALRLAAFALAPAPSPAPSAPAAARLRRQRCRAASGRDRRGCHGVASAVGSVAAPSATSAAAAGVSGGCA